VDTLCRILERSIPSRFHGRMQLMTCYRPWTSESESVSESRRAALLRLLACKNVLEVQCDARPLLLRSLTRRLAESTTTIIIIIIIIIYTSGASVLWRCWLGGRKGIRPIKNWVLAWLSVCNEVQTCIWPSWCHCHSLSLASVKSRLGFTFLAPCVCVCIYTPGSMDPWR